MLTRCRTTVISRARTLPTTAAGPSTSAIAMTPPLSMPTIMALSTMRPTGTVTASPTLLTKATSDSVLWKTTIWTASTTVLTWTTTTTAFLTSRKVAVSSIPTAITCQTVLIRTAITTASAMYLKPIGGGWTQTQTPTSTSSSTPTLMVSMIA